MPQGTESVRVNAWYQSLSLQAIRLAWIGRPILRLWSLIDLLLPKRLDYWAFFCHPLKPDQLIENAHAVYQQVKRDPSIRCVVFHRGGTAPNGPDIDPRTHVVELGSIAGLWTLARCGVLMLTNSAAMDMALRWSNGSYNAPRARLCRRVVINLWHGIPLKRLFALANPEQRRHGDRNLDRRRERAHYNGLVASSDIDSYAMAAIFHPLEPSQVWVTGLPRSDFLLMPESELPFSLTNQIQLLRNLLRGRRLLLYSPTYRDASVTRDLGYCFNEQETTRLRELLLRHDAVLGVRSHYLANGPAIFTSMQAAEPEFLLDLGHASFPEIAPLLRECSALVTDYSSTYIDALYLDRPVVCFAHDLDHYRSHQNGLLYDMELAFPGPVVREFEGLLSALEHVLCTSDATPNEHYRLVKRMFFAYRDANNTQRLVERTQALISARRDP